MKPALFTILSVRTVDLSIFIKGRFGSVSNRQSHVYPAIHQPEMNVVNSRGVSLNKTLRLSPVSFSRKSPHQSLPRLFGNKFVVPTSTSHTELRHLAQGASKQASIRPSNNIIVMGVDPDHLQQTTCMHKRHGWATEVLRVQLH